MIHINLNYFFFWHPNNKIKLHKFSTTCNLVVKDCADVNTCLDIPRGVERCAAGVTRRINKSDRQAGGPIQVFIIKTIRSFEPISATFVHSN